MPISLLTVTPGELCAGFERGDAATLYGAIAAHFGRRIRELNLPLGSRLPGELQLVRELGVGRNTVARSIAALQRDGLVEHRPGIGCFTTDTTRPVVVGDSISWRMRAGRGEASMIVSLSPTPIAPPPGFRADLAVRGYRRDLLAGGSIVGRIDGRLVVRSHSRRDLISLLASERGVLNPAIGTARQARTEYRVSARRPTPAESRAVDSSDVVLVVDSAVVDPIWGITRSETAILRSDVFELDYVCG